MLHFIVRSLGLWLIAAFVVGVVVDGMRTIAASRLVLTSTGQFWALMSPGTLAAAQGSVRRLSPHLWDSVVAPALQAPAWSVFLIVGILLLVIGTRRKQGFAVAT
jgi:hypothetical protein